MLQIKTFIGCLMFLILAPTAFAQTDLIITGTIDGPLTGGVPKAIEFYVVNNIADLSEYGFGSANNGGGTDGEEFTFPSEPATAGDFLYLASESTEFQKFFGFVPNFTGSAANINGDDALELFKNGSVVDIFGDINTDGSGSAWEYLDGWSYRKNSSGPDGNTFVISNWTFSGPNSLDGESTNSSAANPFPLGSYTRAGAGDSAPIVSTVTPANGATSVPISTNIDIVFSEAVTTENPWFEISGSNSGIHSAVVTGGPSNYSLNPDSDFVNNETVTITVLASAVFDNDADDPPDNMNADQIFSFITISSTSTYEIFDIQGSGLASPYEGQSVTTENNIVTAVASDGFAMQTPDTRDDENPQSSNGIWVYTGAEPTVRVGDLVSVSGDVAEFFGLTEFTNSPAVTIVSSGNPLPVAVELDSAVPSPIVSDGMPDLERFEGMLVHIANGTVTGANQEFSSDPIAEVHIVAKPERTFREPGIEFPGLPNLPVWDGNPEKFEMDVDRLGLTNSLLSAGTNFEATGIIGFEFNDYELWPNSLSLSNIPDLPIAVRDKISDEFTIGSLNVERLFSNEDIYTDRLSKLSQYIRIAMKSPDILAIQEVGGLSELNALAAKILADVPAVQYASYFVGSNAASDIFLGYLVKNDVPVDDVTELGGSETYTFGGQTSLLHDRPPLKLNATLPNGDPITVLNLHLRSLNNIDDASEGPRVQFKRDKAATSVSNMVQSMQISDPDINLIVLGDFNAFEFTDGYVDVLGQISGEPSDNSQVLIPGTDIVNPNLINQVYSVPAEKRYSYNFAGDSQVLDHILTSQNLNSFVSGFEFARGNADVSENFRYDSPATALYSSDHDGMVLFIREQQAIPVEVVSFTAASQSGSIQLQWETATESENAGFDIYRSSTENGGYNRINNELIPGQGNSGTGSTYTYNDFDVEFSESYFYKLADVSLAGQLFFHGPVNETFLPSNVDEEFSILPEKITLEQNYPNPFNPETTISFGLPKPANVTLKIYNLLGKEVKSLLENKFHPAGYVHYKWDGRDNQNQLVNTGLFYLRLESNGFVATRKMLVLR
ncbi:MAG: T9SS C-terminal target domain-containing protein [Calditrichaeota bacterium]|nr:MAG: T9SS C-terminal target domain-containing protein [Calditrichota bacterium]